MFWSNEQIQKEWSKISDHYLNRTQRHISLVQKYCERIAEKFYIFDGIVARGRTHDASKFEDPEFFPYVLLTWRYKCEDEGIDLRFPEEIEEEIHKATEIHVRSNDHHPEYYNKGSGDLINKDDRDLPPKQIVDGTKMGILQLAEMVADWSAMSEERGNTPKQWADANIGIRWKFDRDQKDLIYGLIDSIWEG